MDTANSTLAVPALAPDRAVRVWLWLIAALIVAMILLGGATRLTDSGLSITEWRPVTGILPPMNEADWQAAFTLYQQIPEYHLINKGMSLAAFKAIYWWEWSHRFLGRLIGLVFILPLVWFWWRGQIDARTGRRLALIFALGGAQGLLGWYMVMSGLADRVDVSQYRLAAHLGLAFLILAAVLWTIFDLVPAMRLPDRAGRRGAYALCLLIFIQVLLGGLVAGLDAGMTYNTWPAMDGAIVPQGLFVMSPLFVNVFENVKLVQFDHRMLAYGIWLLAGLHWLRLRRAGSARSGAALGLLALVTVQAGIGVAALLALVPVSLGLAHQLGAVIVFAAALRHAHGWRKTPQSSLPSRAR